MSQINKWNDFLNFQLGNNGVHSPPEMLGQICTAHTSPKFPLLERGIIPFIWKVELKITMKGCIYKPAMIAFNNRTSHSFPFAAYQLPLSLIISPVFQEIFMNKNISSIIPLPISFSKDIWINTSRIKQTTTKNLITYAQKSRQPKVKIT